MDFLPRYNYTYTFSDLEQDTADYEEEIFETQKDLVNRLYLTDGFYKVINFKGN